MTNERIRELCARVVSTRGTEFNLAVAELAAALELRESEQPQARDAAGETTSS